MSIDPTATRSLTILQSSFADIFQVYSRGDITLTGNQTCNVLDLRTTSGDILLTGNVTVHGPSTLISGALLAGEQRGDGNIRQAAGGHLAATGFTLGAHGGLIGDPLTPFGITYIDAGVLSAPLTIDALTDTLDAYLTNSGGGVLSLQQSGVSGVFSLRSDASIEQKSGTSISATDIRLITSRGNIGTSENTNAIRVSCDFLSTSSGSGSVFIDDLRDSALNIRQSDSYGPFYVHSSGGMNIFGIKTNSANGSIKAITDKGVLQVMPGAVIDGAPSVQLEVKATELGSRIVIGANAQILANNPVAPEIKISIGDPVPNGPTSLYPTAAQYPNINFVQTTPLTIQFGAPTVSAPTATNSIVANGGAIYLQPYALGSDSIVLGGGDPGVLIKTQSLYTPIPRVGAIPPGKGGTPPGQAQPAPGQNSQTNPAQTGKPPAQTGEPPGLSAPPSGQGAANPGQGIPIPAGQEERVIRLQEMIKRKSSADSTHSTEIATTEESFLPVAFVVHGAIREPALQTLHFANGDIHHDGGATVSTDGCIRIEHGTCLVSSETGTTIRLSEVCIESKRESVILVTCLRNQIVVRNMSGVASIVTSADKFLLFAGQQLRIHKPEDFAADQVATRKVTHHSCGVGEVAIAEFSMTSLYSKSHLLQLLAHSAEPKSRRLFERILKTSAALSIVTANHGKYER